MRIAPEHVAQLEAARREIGLSDDHFLRLLINVGGVSSAAQLDELGADAMRRALAAMGWRARDAVSAAGAS